VPEVWEVGISNMMEDDVETVVYKVDVFKVVLQIKQGIVVTAECSCDGGGSTVVEDIFGYSRDSSELCQHSEESIIYHYSSFRPQIENQVEKIN